MIIRVCLIYFLLLWLGIFILEASILFFLFIGIISLFRRKNFDLRNKRAIAQTILYSPVFGKCHSVKTLEDSQRVVLNVGFIDLYGLYASGTGEFVEVRHEENEGCHMKLKAKSNDSVQFSFISRFSFFPAQVFLRAGDKVKLGANIGYLPFGGKVVIDLPLNAKILLKPKDKVKAFSSLLASFNNEEL
jgi:hypothetical protein|tara:strand:- start:519 stop:1085 length:567 start_codon:yes stop_codon:yes gene_type:complete